MRFVVLMSLLSNSLLDGFNLVGGKITASGARVISVTAPVDDAIHVKVPVGHGPVVDFISVVVGTAFVPLGTHDEGKRRSLQRVIFCFFFLFGPRSLDRKGTMKQVSGCTRSSAELESNDCTCTANSVCKLV